jgi:hypothetical protein
VNDYRPIDPKPVHFVACGLLTVTTMTPLVSSIGARLAAPTPDETLFITVMCSPVIYGFLFAVSLGWFTTVDYNRCLRGSLFLFLLSCVPAAILLGINFGSVAPLDFLIGLATLFPFACPGVLLGSSLGYWVSGIAWAVRRRRYGI